MKEHFKKETVYYSLNIVLPLITGTLLYVLFRPDTIISGLIYKILKQELYLNAPRSYFTDFVRNHLCDILWAYSLTNTVALIFHSERNRNLKPLIICATFEIFLELMQKAKFITGTFDLLDIIFEISITAFATLLINIIFKEKKHEKNS